MTQSQAIIWRYMERTTSAEHSRPFTVKLLHPSTNPRRLLPLGILVPTSAEPALLVVMPTSGKVTYWESLSSVASVDSTRQKQQSVQGTVSGMMSGEVITKITEAEPRGFVLTFSTGRLAHLIVSDPQGKPSINVQYLRDNSGQSGGMFGSLRSVFSNAGWRKDVAAVRAGDSYQRGQRYIVVATTKGTFQVWDLNWNGAHTLVVDVDAKEDLLKALIEGADVFHDHGEHLFEVLDFVILPIRDTGKGIAKLNKTGCCKLMALTVLKGVESSKFALLGLTLANGNVTIDVVHPVSCYKTSMDPDSQFIPQVLVPEPAQTAFVIFEKSIVLVSLVEIEETPSSQLQMEARTLPDPFQDTIDFRKTKPYRVVGCASEAYDRSHAQSACVLMIYGFGLIRIAALPMTEGQSALERATVTAKTKIEQAVFFGNLQQDLLDFTPRPEMYFAPEDVEAAALSIARSIMDSSSAYINSLNPSMDQQLQRRSTALADLNKHLRQHYRPLSRLTRWQLLWNAEKMASAKAIWRCYNTAIAQKDSGLGEKVVLAELIEAMHEDLKTENQPEHSETDGVRHWFIHDVWRLEYILPWAQNMVELLFRESVEDHKELNQATQCKYVSEANDIQLAGLETAFQFREANAAAYGLEDETMVDGVLLQGYEGLPEIWTSIAIIVSRVKTQTDISRELTRLNEDAEGIEGEPSSNLVLKLASENPRQVQICCQTYIERFRWLKSRSDADSKNGGEKLMRDHFAVRKILFASLSDVGQPEKGIQLAEKYHDMEALVTIIDQEMESADSDETIQLLEERIHSYFVKFGTTWANAFFVKRLNGDTAVEVLNNNANFRRHLTNFLRRQPTYAKLGWINEVSSEQNYATAADTLNLAQKQETNLWSKKIGLSMGKLTLLAANAKGQVGEKKSKAASRTIDENVAMIAVQEKLYKYIKPTISDAIDAEAEADLAMQRYGAKFVRGKPILRNALEAHLRKMLAMEALPADALVDILTLIDDEGRQSDDEDFMGTRFFSALKILSLSPIGTDDPGREELLEKFIWRRCMIQDNWEAINCTELKDDTQVEVETGATALFKTLREGYKTGFWDKSPPIPPASLLEAGTSMPSLRISSHFTNTPDNVLTALMRDLVKEDDLLEKYLEKGRLEEWSKGVVDAARASAREEADREGEERLRRRNAEKDLKRRLGKKDREAFGRGGGDENMEIDGEVDVIMDM